jgi:hypothetical protein
MLKHRVLGFDATRQYPPAHSRSLDGKPPRKTRNDRTPQMNHKTGLLFLTSKFSAACSSPLRNTAVFVSRLRVRNSLLRIPMATLRPSRWDCRTRDRLHCNAPLLRACTTQRADLLEHIEPTDPPRAASVATRTHARCVSASAVLQTPDKRRCVLLSCHGQPLDPPRH